MTAHRPDQTNERLVAVLENSIEEARGLRDTLAAERTALEERDPDALERILGAKTAHVETLAALDTERQQLFAAAGIETRRGEGSAIQSATQHAGIDRRWQQLVELADECAQLNQANGFVIRARQSRVDTRLKIIRGEPIAPVTYGHAGDRIGNGHRSLAEA